VAKKTVLILTDVSPSTVSNSKLNGKIPTIFFVSMRFFQLHRLYCSYSVKRKDDSELKAKAVPLHAMKTLGAEEVYLLLILYLGTRRGEVVSVTPRPRFTPGEMTPVTNCTGGSVGSELVWTQRLEEKSFASAGDRTSIARSPSP
jgi:hypothetical protein